MRHLRRSAASPSHFRRPSVAPPSHLRRSAASPSHFRRPSVAPPSHFRRISAAPPHLRSMLPNPIHLDMFWALTNVPDDKYHGDRSEVVNEQQCVLVRFPGALACCHVSCRTHQNCRPTHDVRSLCWELRPPWGTVRRMCWPTIYERVSERASE